MSSKRVAVVTGSNKGIGLQIVRNLCSEFDGVVYLTSRDAGRGLAAVAELNKSGLHPSFHQLDIDDESSVIRLRDHLKETYGGLDVLVNNAAILIRYKEDMHSAEDLAEQAALTMKTNFFNLHRACTILFPILKPHARVVNVSSDFGHLTRIYGTDEAAANLRNKLSSSSLSYEELLAIMQNFVDSAKTGEFAKNGWPDKPEMYTTYKMSKVGVSALTRIQQRDFDKDPRSDLVVNHVHPGWVQTDMSEHTGPLTVKEGAAAPTWLALLPPSADGLKGAYVWFDKQVVDWVNGPMPDTAS